MLAYGDEVSPSTADREEYLDSSIYPHLYKVTRERELVIITELSLLTGEKVGNPFSNTSNKVLPRLQGCPDFPGGGGTSSLKVDTPC